MDWIGVLKDSFFGIIFIVAFTICLHAQQYNTNNIMLFLWASPTAYFYLLYLVMYVGKNNKKGSHGFFNNAILGTLLTLSMLFLSIYLVKHNYSNISILLITGLMTLFFTILYFMYEVYNKSIFI